MMNDEWLQATLRLPLGYPEATLKPYGSQPVATPKPPRGYPEATLRLPSGYPEATPRLPRGYLEATLGGKVHPEAQNRAESKASCVFTISSACLSSTKTVNIGQTRKPRSTAFRPQQCRMRPSTGFLQSASAFGRCCGLKAALLCGSAECLPKMWVMTRIENLHRANRWCSPALSLPRTPHQNHTRIERT
jgi:hypothetical protein